MKQAARIRQSNIEALRIFSMLLIILHHYCVHGPWPKDGSLTMQLTVNIASLGGKLGVDCFILITGYFLVRSAFKSRSLLRCILQTWFYSVVLFAAFAAFSPGRLANIDVPSVFMPVVSGEYWFITNYVALVLVSPALNLLLSTVDDTARERLVMVLVIITCIVPTLTTKSFVSSNFIEFVCLYIIGGTMRLSARSASPRTMIVNPIAACNRIKPATVAATSLVIVILLTVIVHLANDASGSKLLPERYFLQANSWPLMFLAVSLFRCFSDADFGRSRVINVVASCAFGVYLIHDNPIVRKWIWPHFAFAYDMGPIGFVLIGFASAIAVYAVFGLVDWIRQKAVEPPIMFCMEKLLTTQLDRVDAWFNRIAHRP